VVPLQVLENRQIPPDPQAFVQHWTSVGSLGQNPGMDVPPEDEQELVVRQTPGVLPAVQGSSTAACADVSARRKIAARIIL
jgi:hypothetical protein